ALHTQHTPLQMRNGIPYTSRTVGTDSEDPVEDNGSRRRVVRIGRQEHTSAPQACPERAMVAAVPLPVLAAAESAMCLWLWSRAGTPSSFGWHGGALFVAIWAE